MKKKLRANYNSLTPARKLLFQFFAGLLFWFVFQLFIQMILHPGEKFSMYKFLISVLVANVIALPISHSKLFGQVFFAKK